MAAKLRAPGWYRAGTFFALGIGFALRPDVPAARALRLRPASLDGDAVLTVALISAPLFFLVGLGAFDYWFYWASGTPTRPEDHSRPRRQHAGRTTSGSTPTTR